MVRVKKRLRSHFDSRQIRTLLACPFATLFAMASNPWLAGVNVSKCPVCDVRLLNGSCIDHGPPAAEEVDDLPEDPKKAAEPETPEDSKKPAEPEEKPEDKLEEKLEEKPEDKPEDKLEEKPEEKPEDSQKKRRKKMIVDTDSEDTPASDQQTEQPPKADEALH